MEVYYLKYLTAIMFPKETVALNIMICFSRVALRVAAYGFYFLYFV
jgi:hypothetical protein